MGPTERSSPVVVECPHAGLEVPADVRSLLLHDEPSMRRDADLDVDRLVGDVTSTGALLLEARVSRYVVDLNRAPDDVDPLLFGPAFGRRGVPRGVLWRVTTEGRPLLPRALSTAEAAARVERYHAPYHATLERTIAALRERHRAVVVLALHSMPSSGRVAGSDAFVRRADVVPGTRGRTSADPRFVEEVDRHFRDAGYSVRHDDPYRGGYTTGHYGRPRDGVHAIQIELSRALYLDEATLVARDGDVQRLRRQIAALAERLATVATTR